jgi:hypothetical protein
VRARFAPLAATPFCATESCCPAATATSVAQALSRGATAEEIRRWCLRTLQPHFASQTQSILFPAYFAILAPR